MDPEIQSTCCPAAVSHSASGYFREDSSINVNIFPSHKHSCGSQWTLCRVQGRISPGLCSRKLKRVFMFLGSKEASPEWSLAQLARKLVASKFSRSRRATGFTFPPVNTAGNQTETSHSFQTDGGQFNQKRWRWCTVGLLRATSG